jgi:predicted SnoaL-like aldol condensation-catalyzing enzyme
MVALMAEGRLCWPCLPRTLDPKEKAKKYTTVGFTCTGSERQVIEHWDAALKGERSTALRRGYARLRPAEDSGHEGRAGARLSAGFYGVKPSSRRREAIEKYFASNFIQHAATMAPGLEGIRNMVNRGQPQAAPAKTGLRPTTLIAEGDLVAAVFPRQYPDPKDASKKYSTAGLELYRIANGKIVEHWDEHEKPGN